VPAQLEIDRPDVLPQGLSAEDAVKPDRVPPARAVSGAIAWEDWDDPTWVRFVDIFSPDPNPATLDRSAWQWERIHLLYGLERCGKLTSSSRVLAAAIVPDPRIAELSEWVGRVDVLDLTGSPGRAEAEGRIYWSAGALYARDRFGVHAAPHGFEDLEPGGYDAVVFPHNSLFTHGIAGISRLMAKAERVLAPEGVLVFNAEILSGSDPDMEHLDTSQIAGDGLVAQIESATGFVVPGGFDARLTRRTAESVQSSNAASTGGLLSRVGDRIAVSSLWFLQRQGQTPEGGWQRVEQWFLRRLLGEQLPRLQIGQAGRRDEEGRIEAIRGRKGHVFFGPYLALPSGRYEAIVRVETPRDTHRRPLSLEVVVGETPLASKTLRLGQGEAISVSLPFAVPQSNADSFAKIEIRARSFGRLGAVFSQCMFKLTGD
jgi:hypothetical protein